MYAIRREPSQPVMPTGPNPMFPLSDFEVKKLRFNLTTQIPYGAYCVEIDPVAEVGFFEHAVHGICGQFWLAGAVLIASDHLLPRDVRYALERACIEVK